MVDIQTVATNESVPDDAIFVVWVPGMQPDDPGRTITLDLPTMTALLGSGIVRGQIERHYQALGAGQLVLNTSGPYQIGLQEWNHPNRTLEAGDKLLLRCFSNDGEWVLRSPANDRDAPIVSDLVSADNDFAVLTLTQDVTGYSIWLEGEYTGQLSFNLFYVHRSRGSNDAALEVEKIDITVAPDLENFPPEQEEHIVYSEGDKVRHENAIYQSLVDNNLAPLTDTSAWRKIFDGSSISASDIDARVAYWAARGNTDEIPISKLPDLGTDGIPSNMVENFAKTNFPDTIVRPEKLPALNASHSASSISLGYAGQSGAYTVISQASQLLAGLLSPTDWSKLQNLANWAYNSDRLPKSKLPADTAYQLTWRGLWRTGSYTRGQICYTDDSEHGGLRLWIARSDTTANPLDAGQTGWWELVESNRINMTAEGRLTLDNSRGRDIADNNPMYWRGNWADGRDYYKGNVVNATLNGYQVLWICIANHTSSASNSPTSLSSHSYWSNMILGGTTGG